LRRWLASIELEVTGPTPTGKTLDPEQQQIQALETQGLSPRSNRWEYAYEAVAG